MTYSILILAIVCFIITLCNCIFWPKVRQSTHSHLEKVSVLIPARNEGMNLAQSLESILEQGASVLEILIYDDHSTDNTLQIINNYSAKFPKVKRVETEVLLDGWFGKPFACAQLAKRAKGEWLLFLDADTRLRQNAINRMLDEVSQRQVTFLSCWPEFQMVTVAEKILMPFLNFVVFSIFPSPLLLLKRPEFEFNPRLGLAHGACMFFESKSYRDFGGHERVKDQIFEDTRIAQLWRVNGNKGICLDGQKIAYLRMYSSLREIWSGFQKNFYPAFQHKYNFWAFLSLHTIIFIYPFIVFAIHFRLTAFLAIISCLLIRIILIIRFRQSILTVIFHPLGELFMVLLGLSSWWHCAYGKGVIWKGREYHRNT